METIEAEFPAGQNTRHVQAKRDPLLIAIYGTVLALSVLVLGTMIVWGSGPVLAKAPWYIPLISAFISLITILIGYLAPARSSHKVIDQGRKPPGLLPCSFF